MTEAKVKVFIYGSCVSRDTIEVNKDQFELVGYVARQSAISAFAPADGVLERLKEIPSKFQQRMVRGDVTSSLSSELDKATSADVLLIDLIDERGGVIELGGGYVSKLHEFWGAGGREISAGARTVEFGTDEHFGQWTQSINELVRILIDRELLCKCIVLKTPWASKYVDGTIYETPAWMKPPQVADELYERYFSYLSGLGLSVVELPEDLARTDTNHQWGASPFHYINAAYAFMGGRISDICSEKIKIPKGIRRRNVTTIGNLVERDSLEELMTAYRGSGHYTWWVNGRPIDILVEDEGADTTVVSLHAALGKSGLNPPVFTGRSISAGLKLNRIFVSDPTLYEEDELGLGWYLGGGRLNATKRLVELVTALQSQLGAKYLAFFGMSGGGFASLNLSWFFPGSLALPVNPQTRILDYWGPAWQAYAAAAFDSAEVEKLELLVECHERSDMRRVYSQGFSNYVVYVQNRGDAHLKTQLIPWIEKVEDRGRYAVLLGNWGNGHTPPPATDLRELLAKVALCSGDWDALSDDVRAVPRMSSSRVKRVAG